MPIGEDKRSGVSGGVTAVTSTVGNGVGGLLGTVGDVTGAAGRGCALSFLSSSTSSNYCFNSTPPSASIITFD
jgi:hypothetical protein